MTLQEFREDPFHLCEWRTKKSYDDDVKMLQKDDNIWRKTGIKRNSVFNELSNFHVTSGLPPCLAHDLYDGVVKSDLALILNQIIREGYLTDDTISARIFKGPFKEGFRIWSKKFH
ncbi:unnamed protein product [Didymodactylos carnosus]|uniref:Uncharacterized protein n=1 Tax=Didymodactylos carnosus TaxID=1234261 RepID=A0A815YIP7_9BILA|nr:unnamed protein product [Didymodactylos carnosus]CAF1571241.1 unnamed protein product [Didymodactylos carnosus]CAF4060708.1 unnamed protein product [Didymodactylos carnosus]CAF4434724.1 unnamed protein product [Didymodactylos carnosus]